MKKIYMDYAASTPVDKQVIDSMIPYFTKYYGNASSLHSFGRDADAAIEESRNKVGSLLNATADEIIFTAGGTESDNIAIKGITYLNKDKKESIGPHIITSAIEHPAVMDTCKFIEQQGFKVKYLPVDRSGIVNVNELERSLTKNTILISIMFANNEIGTIQPIKEIGKIAKAHDILFHTDAVQAISTIPINVNNLNIDLLSISSHKIHGPKGVGALYIRKGLKLEPIIHGGGHEKGLRSSTHNTPGIVGLGKACELAQQRMEKDPKFIKNLRDRLIKSVLKIDESYLTGHSTKRLVNNAHFYFTAIEGESLILSLDDKGIAASTGSACSSTKLQASHVLLALGLDPTQAHGSLRLTLGRENKLDEVTYVADVLPDVITRLRKMSPLWNDKEKR